MVSFLPDVAGRRPAHTLFCVWRVFGTEAEAEDWIVNVAGHRVRDFSFDTVSLYEWLKPQTVDTAMHWPLRAASFGFLFLGIGLVGMRARSAARRMESEDERPDFPPIPEALNLEKA